MLVRDTLPPIIRLDRKDGTTYKNFYDGAVNNPNYNKFPYSHDATLDGWKSHTGTGGKAYSGGYTRFAPTGKNYGDVTNADGTVTAGTGKLQSYASVGNVGVPTYDQVGGDSYQYIRDAKYGHRTDSISLAEDASVQSGINGWVVGAIASAISGLALLGYAGYSMKKRNGYSSTVLSVPV